jgi:hypothetical protein
MRRPHDIGGLEADDIDTGEHSTEPWEKRVRVMAQLLARRSVPILSRDELRRGIEDLGTEEYNRLSYHERWAASITNIMLQKGVIDVDELGRKMQEVEERWRKDRVS